MDNHKRNKLGKREKKCQSLRHFDILLLISYKTLLNFEERPGGEINEIN